jgi:hypothetical protein
MNGNGDPLDDILAMVVFGILDPKYLTGEEKPPEKPSKKDDTSGSSSDKGKKT